MPQKIRKLRSRNYLADEVCAICGWTIINGRCVCPAVAPLNGLTPPAELFAPRRVNQKEH
jgi:hypothetical protein